MPEDKNKTNDEVEQNREELEEVDEKQQDEKQQGEETKTDKVKHEWLTEEQRRLAESKERFKDFARNKMRHDTRGTKRKRKEKFLGGTRGRRGG